MVHEAITSFRQRQDAKRTRAGETAKRRLDRGKGTARERIDLLLDPGSFTEIGGFARHRSSVPELAADRPLGDAVVTGHGTVHGRPVCVFAQDFTVFGGSLGEVVGEKIGAVMDLAAESGVPVVGINDSAGGRIQEGVVAQALYGRIFTRNVRMSGSVPQISLVMGPCAGGAVYSPALTDFVVMVDRTSHMFITGPAVLRDALGEDVGLDDLGGAWTHNLRGNAHHVAATEADAIEYVRALLAFLPAGDDPVSRPDPRSIEEALTSADRALEAVVPDGPDDRYDVRAVLGAVFDGGDLLEVHRWFAPTVLVGFARLGGRAVGVVANQPAESDGRLDVDACVKAARFVRTCDAYGLPVVTFVDVPGFRAGVDQEWAGGARRGAALLHAYAEASVPLLTVVLRHAAGIGYVAMGSRHLGADYVLAWPTARIGGDEPYEAAERGYVDEVVEPSHTRLRLERALRLLRAKRRAAPIRKHENLPL